jgi:hypothetical protein
MVSRCLFIVAPRPFFRYVLVTLEPKVARKKLNLSTVVNSSISKKILFHSAGKMDDDDDGGIILFLLT